jgi:hypothetical protein
VVLGPPALEEPARVSGRRRAGTLALVSALVGLGLGAVRPERVAAVGEDPAAELTEALHGLGPPGMVWGRLVVEEESPVGPWTPLDGIEVTLYPATPTLIAELEGIRQSARTSSAQYESAVTRVQAALTAHKSRVERQSAPAAEVDLVAEPPPVAKPRPTKTVGPPAAESPSPQGGTVVSGSAGAGGRAAGPPPEAIRTWRQKTDSAGLFAFDSVPSGDWIVVVFRVSPYGTEKLRSEPKLKQPSRAQRFLPRATGPAKEAEFWITRIRVIAGERLGLELTDRARWMAGPVR